MQWRGTQHGKGRTVQQVLIGEPPFGYMLGMHSQAATLGQGGLSPWKSAAVTQRCYCGNISTTLGQEFMGTRFLIGWDSSSIPVANDRLAFEAWVSGLRSHHATC